MAKMAHAQGALPPRQSTYCNVFSRRYFYPLLTDFAPYADAKGSCPIAEDAASRVLTLPTYYGLALEDVRAIARNVLEIVG